jgi:hypothetical protein
MATRTEVAAKKLREAWLLALVAKLAPEIEARAGLKMPPILISVGFPSSGGLNARGKTAIGQCWLPQGEGKPAHIFVSPLISEPNQIVYIVAHEMLHAALPAGAGHKKPFQVAAKAIGHTAPFTECHSEIEKAPAFFAWATQVLDALPAYPHDALGAPATKEKKQSTRMLKAECPACGYTVRLAKKWVVEVGAPICPKHDVMIVELPDDEEGDELRDALSDRGTHAMDEYRQGDDAEMDEEEA